MRIIAKPDVQLTSDDSGWIEFLELLGHGVLLLVRWPFTSFWKDRELDYDSPNPVPESDLPYRLLCAFGAFVEVMLVALPLSRRFDSVYAPVWIIWVTGLIFLVLTGIRIYLYGRNEAHGWP